MKKLFTMGMLGVLLLLTIWRWNARGQPLDLYSDLHMIGEHGQFFSLDDIYQDLQYINYNTDSLTNMWTAEPGQYYTYYVFRNATQGEPEEYVDTVNGIYGNRGIQIKQYIIAEQRQKEEMTSAWQVLDYVADSVKSVVRSAYYIGWLAVDTVKSVLKGLWGLIDITTKIIFG